MSNGLFSSTNPADVSGRYPALVKIIQALINRVATANLVTVISCTNDGGFSPIGTVTVQIMVNQVNPAGQPQEHGEIFDVPYYRLQGGTKAVILDPQPDDIGLAIFAMRDITNVKNSAQISNPASRRVYDYTDALYMGCYQGGTPISYVQFEDSGAINIVSPVEVKTTAPTIETDSTTTNVNASQNINETALQQLNLTGVEEVNIDGDVITLGGTSLVLAASVSVSIASPDTTISGYTPPGGSGINQLTGDVTAGPGSGSQAATIGANKVTFAKFQQVGAGKLLGNPTASTADAEEISIGTGLSYSGSTLEATGGGGSLTVTDGTNTEASVTTLQISGGAVSTNGAGNATININITSDVHPVTPTAWDDEFEFGSSLDISGARRSGANAWTVANANTTTNAVQNGALGIAAAGGSTNNDTVYWQTLTGAGATWAFECKRLTNDGVAFNGMWVGFEATGLGYYFGFFAGTTYLISQSNYAGSGAGVVNDTASFTNAQIFTYYRIAYNGTDLIFSLSLDGFQFFQLASVSLSAFLGSLPDSIGLYAGAASPLSGMNFSTAYDWFRKTA